MYRFNDLRIRKFEFEDIDKKIKWINDPNNNSYLHYDLPLDYDKTRLWFLNNKDRIDRYDGIIEYQNKPIGIIGLINIDNKNKKAEGYIVIGENDYKGKNIGMRAIQLRSMFAFYILGLEKCYAYIEDGNENSIKLCLASGYQTEGYLKKDLFYNGRSINRFAVALYKENFIVPDDVYYEV